MKKIKITTAQKLMLENKASAKLKEDITRSNSPSAKVTDSFKKGTSGLDGFKAEGVEANAPQISWSELVVHVHEFLTQIYTKPNKEDLKPFWDTVDVTWDELIGMLTAVELIKSVKGGYRLTKVAESPAKVVKIVAKLIEKMINDKTAPIEELEDKDITGDYFKSQIGTPKKSGKTRAEILAVIAKKRQEELDRRKAEAAQPIGEVDGMGSGIEMILSIDSLYIFRLGGKLLIFNTENRDNNEFNRLKKTF